MDDENDQLDCDEIGQYLPIGKMNNKYNKYIDQDKYYTVPTEEECDIIEDKKCICDIRELMANGCKCGGK